MSSISTELSFDATAYNEAIQSIRKTEYPMIQDSVYLDHGGTTLCSKSLMEGFASEMISVLYANPHSASSPSQLSTTRIENVRLELLKFFNADPQDFDLVFVANATAGVKLVVEGMRSLPNGFLYAHHQACHTSLVGVREEAKFSVCLDDEAVEQWLSGKLPFDESAEEASATLVSYTAQSHMDGRRYPRSWSDEFRQHAPEGFPRAYTLLDAASLAATSPLDLGDAETAPDFTVLSLYKIFGFPDLGVLIVRRQAEPIFNQRKYFGGGTVDIVVTGKEQWHAPKSSFLHERLEDGTLPFHSIIAVDTALKVHTRLFGSVEKVSMHTAHLTQYLLRALDQLRHGNGNPVCTIYSERSQEASDRNTGPVVSFNIRNALGAWISLAEFDKLANLKMIHVRTGGVCSPGGTASALGLEPWEMRRNFSSGFRCGTEDDIIAGKPTGVIRVSFGAMSTLSDVQRFVDFMEEYFVETSAPLMDFHTNLTNISQHNPGFMVKAITVYPIKSCAGFSVPKGSSWGIRPEGLAWDREWCLVHKGSGQALSQKRYTKMALIYPSLDFEGGVLRIKCGKDSVTVPLSSNPALFEASERQLPSRVCGEEILPQIYKSEEINNFFSSVLGVPCVLARFPPGGRNLASRSSKASIQSYQELQRQRRMPGTFHDIPSPPDSETEKPSQQRRGRILLSNESPILMINRASVDALNQDIVTRGGSPVDETAFRANIVIQCNTSNDDREKCLGSDRSAYLEDVWTSVHIGKHAFRMLGACRRCQMVCVNQATGEKGQEPFSTLAKTRRFDGKVYFGAHMGLDVSDEMRSQEAQYPTIQIGDSVAVHCD